MGFVSGKWSDHPGDVIIPVYASEKIKKQEASKMKVDQEKVTEALQAVEKLCQHCGLHTETCYVAVAMRSLSTLKCGEDSTSK